MGSWQETAAVAAGGRLDYCTLTEVATGHLDLGNYVEVGDWPEVAYCLLELPQEEVASMEAAEARKDSVLGCWLVLVPPRRVVVAAPHF